MFENILNKNTVLTSFVALGYLTPELFVVFSSGGYRESMNWDPVCSIFKAERTEEERTEEEDSLDSEKLKETSLLNHSPCEVSPSLSSSS